MIFLEKIFCHFENAIRHKRSGEDVDRVMHVSEKNRDTEYKSGRKLQNSPQFIIPENESDEDGQSGVRREKITRFEAERQIELIKKSCARDDLAGIDAEMRNGDEDSAQGKKYGYGFQCKNNVAWFPKDEYRAKKNRPERSFHNDEIQVDNRKMVKQEIADVLGRNMV